MVEQIEEIRTLKISLTRKQTIYLAMAVAIVGWHWLKPVTYNLIWGQKVAEKDAPLNESFEDLGNQAWQAVNISGYDILYRLRVHYKVRGRVVWVDWNDGIINTWYHSAGKEGTKLYNAVAAVDVSIVHGKTSDENNLKKIKFDHEERGLTYKYMYADNPIINRDEINNNHVIPATRAVRRAIALIKKGDVAEFEGYLMDWRGTGKFSWFHIETATQKGEVHTKQLYGGLPGAEHCRQFYVTKVIYNGYQFE